MRYPIFERFSEEARGAAAKMVWGPTRGDWLRGHTHPRTYVSGFGWMCPIGYCLMRDGLWRGPNPDAWEAARALVGFKVEEVRDFVVIKSQAWDFMDDWDNGFIGPGEVREALGVAEGQQNMRQRIQEVVEDLVVVRGLLAR